MPTPPTGASIGIYGRLRTSLTAAGELSPRVRLTGGPFDGLTTDVDPSADSINVGSADGQFTYAIFVDVGGRFGFPDTWQMMAINSELTVSNTSDQLVMARARAIANIEHYCASQPVTLLNSTIAALLEPGEKGLATVVVAAMVRVTGDMQIAVTPRTN